jgi:TatD DNase family protein
MTYTDTHCHIHEKSYVDAEAAYKRAIESGIVRLICVGTDGITSGEAVKFAASHENCWASIGIHPHEAANNGVETLRSLLQPSQPLQDSLRSANSKIVAIGECGLDYFYEHSPRDKQIEILHAQIELAQKHNLPMIFHVRDAFDDFWPIFDQYQGLRGVLHSFTDTQENLDKALERGLYIGVNGISTFTKVEEQKKMYASIPLSRLLLETDAPYLTPVPLRGTLNEPAFITHIAQHIVNLQSITLEELSRATERNATTLFSLNK